MLCLLTGMIGLAQNDGKPALGIADDGHGGLQARFRMPRVTIVSLGQDYCTLEVDGMSSGTGLAGCPDLPTLSILVRLPAGSTLTASDVTVDEAIEEPSFARPLAPVTEGWAKDQPRPDYHPDAKVYTTDDFYRGGDLLEVSHLGRMGREEVFRLTVRPVAYNPVSGALKVCRTVEAQLKADRAEAMPLSGRGGYLIVSRPEFRDGLQSFVRWKQQEGFVVSEIYADTHKRDSIKALISPYFAPEAPRWPDYVLLVGDAAQIQAFLGTTHPSGLSNHITDLYYVEHTGDYLPDAIVGRWPVNDTAELRVVVEKTLRYEQGRDLDTMHLKRLLLVAGDENQTPAPVTTNAQVNYLAHEAVFTHPTLDTLCYHNPASSTQRNDILADLQQGVALLNYTAHCTLAGWSSPSVSFSSIDTLDNPHPLLYVNNCCQSNAFTGTCFGEQLLRKSIGGAIGVIGATNSTLWNEDFYWAVGPKYPFTLNPAYDEERLGAFDRWIGRYSDLHTQGELLTAGNLAVTAFGSPYDKFYWEIYCLFGDPSLMPWVGVPQTINLHTTNGAPHNGDGCLYLSGTTGVTVTAMQHDTVLGIGAISADGLLVLNLSHSLDTTPLIITATACGHLPRIDTLEVLPVTGLGVALRQVNVSDSMVSCLVENVGTEPLYGLRIVLSQLDADSTVDALIAEQQTVIDTLLPTQNHHIVLPVQVVTIGQYPSWEASLFAWDSTEGMLSWITLRQTMDVNYPEATFRLLESDSSMAHRLLPQHNYLLETVVDGAFDNLDLTVTALPSEDTLFSPFTTPDTLTHLHIEALLRQGNYQKNYDYFLVEGHRMDSYEEGFSSYPWQQGGTLPWRIDSTVSHSGRYSVRSGAIDYRQTSDLVLEVFLPQADTISYWFKTSCEAQYDKFIFTVDGTQRGDPWWGESQWIQRTHPLTAGHHTLRWRYIKDDSGSGGSDCVWIDDVCLPLALWDSTYGWFGDTTLLGIEVLNTEHTTLSLYPNPTTGAVTVAGAEGCTLRIFDIYGHEIYSLPTLHFPLTTLHLDFLPEGVYLLQAIGDHNTDNRKLIIHH